MLKIMLIETQISSLLERFIVQGDVYAGCCFAMKEVPSSRLKRNLANSLHINSSVTTLPGNSVTI